MKKFYEIWKKIAEKIGDFQASVLFSFMYFLIVTPIGFIARYFKDFHSERHNAEWAKIEDNSSSIDKLKLQ